MHETMPRPNSDPIPHNAYTRDLHRLQLAAHDALMRYAHELAAWRRIAVVEVYQTTLPEALLRVLEVFAVGKDSTAGARAAALEFLKRQGIAIDPAAGDAPRPSLLEVKERLARHHTYLEVARHVRSLIAQYDTRGASQDQEKSVLAVLSDLWGFLVGKAGELEPTLKGQLQPGDGAAAAISSSL